MFLLKQAAVLHGAHEKTYPRKLSPPPDFVFADDFKQTNSKYFGQKSSKSSVKLLENTDRERLYDEMDVTQFGKHVMPLYNVGVLNYPQYYYFDMTSFGEQQYYINVTNNQLSGIRYDENEKRFFGLERHEDKQKDGTVKNVLIQDIPLEQEWVERFLPTDFLKCVKEKATLDNNKYLKCPVGNAKETFTPDYLKMNPKIQYMQNGNANCIFTSLASALYYMKFESLSMNVIELQKKFQNTSFDFSVGNLHREVNKKVYSIGCRDFNRAYTMRRIKCPEKFNILEFGAINET